MRLFFVEYIFGRDDVTRTRDPYVPNVVRYQLRYISIPWFCAVISALSSFFSRSLPGGNSLHHQSSALNFLAHNLRTVFLRKMILMKEAASLDCFFPAIRKP